MGARILFQADARFAAGAEREDLHVDQISRPQDVLQLAMGPGHVGRGEGGGVVAEFDRRRCRRRRRNQGMNIVIRLRLIVPVGVLVVRESDIVGQDVGKLSLPAVAALIGGQAVEHRLIRGALQVHVERGIDPQSPLVHAVGAVLVFQIAANLLDEIGGERIGVVRQLQVEGLVAGCNGLGRSDSSIFEHGIDHQVATLEGAVGMVDRRIHARGFRQAGQHRGFIQAEPLGGLAEVVFGRGLKSVDAVPQVNLIGVEGEDLLLGESALDLNRQERFLDFAVPGPVGRKKKIAGQLHGEGGSTLHFAARFDIAIGRPYDAPNVDPPMPVEVFVFDRDQGIPENRGKVVIGSHHPSLQSEGADDASLVVVQLGDRARTIVLEFFHLGQARGVDQHQPGGSTHQGRNQEE